MYKSELLDISNVIDRHLKNDSVSRGEKSQDILSQTRNLIEHTILDIYIKSKKISIKDGNLYCYIQDALAWARGNGKFKDLIRFHHWIQATASHYTLNEEYSERLLLKYHLYLFKIKEIVKTELGINILENLDLFNINEDDSCFEFYSKVVQSIHKTFENLELHKLYVYKTKPFFMKGKVYYEITLLPARDYVSKMQRIIAFSEEEILGNYAVDINLEETNIDISGSKMPIYIIRNWKTSIRKCEYDNFNKIINGSTIKLKSKECRVISNFLHSQSMNLLELVLMDNEYFDRASKYIEKEAKSNDFFKALKIARTIIWKERPGHNILRYLLCCMTNIIIKDQYMGTPNKRLSNLYLDYKCIPFDDFPFSFSMKKHNTNNNILFQSIESKNHLADLLARKVKQNIEQEGELFTECSSLEVNIHDLIEEYNKNLFPGHKGTCSLEIYFKNYISINGYINAAKFIIFTLHKLYKRGIDGYRESVEQWINTNNIQIDAEDKKEVILRLFENGQLALIYGAAGTGKTTLMNYIAKFWGTQNFSMLFLAQTNTAVDNMKRRIQTSNADFMTISKYLYKREPGEYDIIFIDECSTISNSEMKSFLKKTNINLLVLVGDPYQIEAIQFGNWFSNLEYFESSKVFKLEKTYRTKNSRIMELWDRVRLSKDDIKEILVRERISKRLNTTFNESIFNPVSGDEIILCLNYDGIYGINNINRYMQENNNNCKYVWGTFTFKVNDPILFNDSPAFYPVLYNNLKGRILDINIKNVKERPVSITFEVEVESTINEASVRGSDISFLGISENGLPKIRFSIFNRTSEEEDDDSNDDNTIIPFQVSYAVSIHKAQGLEYESVKIIISKDVDEEITHNIFYTAITRTKQFLSIYWEPEVEEYVLNNIKRRDNKSTYYKLKKLLDDEAQ